MAKQGAVKSREIGQVRIYFTRDERHPQRRSGWRRFLPAPPLYMEIIKAAKEDGGIVNATAHYTHYGYSGHGVIQQSHAEIENPHLTLCVELVGPRPRLQAFCRTHGDLLRDKVILYKHLEHWDLAHGLKVKPASRKEISMALE